ncbi:MAG: hypothetical protein WDN24_14240 [Sphingomonas sp.]
MAHHRHALRSLAAVSFAESSFFPIPPDAMLVPMVLARRDQAWLIAGVCTAASVVGGMFGYAIGYFLTDTARWMLEFFRHGAFEDFTAAYNQIRHLADPREGIDADSVQAGPPSPAAFPIPLRLVHPPRDDHARGALLLRRGAAQALRRAGAGIPSRKGSTISPGAS